MGLVANKLSKKEALEIVGGLSEPGKMPGYGWSIPASQCKRGSSLAKIEGTVCHGCYALKNRYVFPNVQNALTNRLEKFEDPRWVEAMVTLLEGEKYFRWFDSGDLQSVEMLIKIEKVCRKTPHVKHWMPTREYGIIKEFKKTRSIPQNLTIRISNDFVEEREPKRKILGCNYSTVVNKMNTKAFNCPVSFYSKKGIKSCEDAECRACWDKEVRVINYKPH